MSVAPPRLRPACFADHPRIYQLESAHFQEYQPFADWQGFWVENPLWSQVRERWLIGWVLEADDGRIVGTFGNIPSRYHFRGRELLCANGRAWVVLPEYRGFALFLVNEYFSQSDVDLFVNTTVGPMAVQAIGSFSERVPVGDWQTAAYLTTGYREFAQRALEKLRLPRTALLAAPMAAALWLKDALFTRRLPGPPPGIEIQATSEFDARFDPFWEELLRLNPHRLLGARDRRTLVWHYARPLRRGRLWIATASRNGLLRAFCVVKRQDLGEGLRRLRLVDFQTVEPDANLLPCLLRPMLKRAASEGFSVLEHLGCNLPELRAFDRQAPYRRKFESWQYFYQATDPGLQDELCNPNVWAPSAYDGDASLE